MDWGMQREGSKLLRFQQPGMVGCGKKDNAEQTWLRLYERNQDDC